MVWALASSWHLSQPCCCDCGASHTIPTSSHCCHSPITLPMGTHIGTNSWNTLGASQSCSSWKSLWKRSFTSKRVYVGNSCVFRARQEDRWLPNPRDSSACKMYLPYSVIWCENYHQVPVSPDMTAEQGVCWPVHVSPSSCTRRMLSPHLSQLCKATHWAETTPLCKWHALLTLREWRGMLLPSCCIPQRAPEVLLFVSESVQATLAVPQPTWLKGHHMFSAKGGCVTTPHLFAKQALIFPVSLQQDTFHKALFRAQPPCSGSLEVSATQIQSRRTKKLW